MEMPNGLAVSDHGEFSLSRHHWRSKATASGTRRRLWLSPSTRQPDAAWVTQQAERFQQNAKVDDLPLTILMRDNDMKYPPAFDEVFRKAGVEVPKMPPRGGPDAALSVWVVEQQEDTEDSLAFQYLLFLRHPDIQSDVWATPRRHRDTETRRHGDTETRRRTSLGSRTQAAEEQVETGATGFTGFTG